ncbi:MAG: hypothetical protein RL313_560 [Actinomycetota bacterium]
MKRTNLATSILLALSLCISALSSSAIAASKEPTPKATATKKATETKKATPSKKATATKKPATKKPAPKKKKKKPKPKVSVTPSPAPKWPPVGFSQEGEVYAKQQTSAKMNSDLARWKGPYVYLKPYVSECKTLACGNVLVASENSCTWWEADAYVYNFKSPEDKTLVRIGTARSVSGPTKAKEYAYLLFRTNLPIAEAAVVKLHSATCHHDAPPEKTLDWSFTPTR